MYIAIDSLQNAPLRFEHTYPNILATFQSISGSSFMPLIALSWLPQCSKSIQNIYLCHHFDFGEELEGARCQIW